jgi:membrane peptidoglycan carboxypeptidase
MCGILAGIVVAAAAFPLVGSVGLTAKAASDSFEELPSDLKAGPPPLTSTLSAADGTRITSFYEENRVNIPLEQMAKTMQDAIIAAEDARFWEHRGTDPKGIMRAVFANLVSDSGQTQGGSTLTQQYVKQALFYSAKTPAERRAAIAPNGGRKLREVRYAVALEQKLTKKDILARYLNIANFGNNTYGVAAASQRYFSKTAAQLTLPEAALLASIVKNPDKYEPIGGDRKRAQQRRDYVIDRMVDQGLVDQKQADAAKKLPITIKGQKAPRKCENGDPKYGFYCGWFIDWWRANPKFGATPDEREANLYKGGYKITTALDPKVQAHAQKAVDSELQPTNKYALGTVIIQPGTGRVLAMAVNRKFGLTPPATTDALLSGNKKLHGYQAGSTFKMFTMVAALEQGKPLTTSIYSPQRYKSKYFAGGDCDPHWCPSNASPAMTGSHTMWSGFGKSVNTYFVQLEERVSVKAAVLTAEKMGVRFRDEESIKNRAAALKTDTAWGAFTLGVAPVTPLDMATAYATIAARGKYCAPTPLLKILDRDNKPLPHAAAACSQVLRPEVADAAADAARCPVGDRPSRGSCGGNGTVQRVRGEVDRPIAGKSGTTDLDEGTPTAWFVGFTPNIAAAGFIADPKGASNANLSSSMQKKPASVFIKTMKPVFETLPEAEFVDPPDNLTRGVRVTVPDVDGESLATAKSELEAAGFSWQIADQKEGSDSPAGTVARTDPSGGSTSTQGGSVTIYVSNGSSGFINPPFDETPGQPGGGNPGNGNGNPNDGPGDGRPPEDPPGRP